MAAYETSVLLRRYFRVTKSSPEPLDPRGIQVRIEAWPDAGRPEPNTVATALLWAHFEACRQGRLAEDLPTPWEQLGREHGDPAWIRFLSEVLAGRDLERWIDEPQEVRRRALAAYRRADQDAAGPLHPRRGATSRDIQRWVKRTYGFVPHRSWIASCKQRCGLPVRRGRRGSEPGPPCPEDTRGPIEAAFRHFGLLAPADG